MLLKLNDDTYIDPTNVSAITYQDASARAQITLNQGTSDVFVAIKGREDFNQLVNAIVNEQTRAASQGAGMTRRASQT